MSPYADDELRCRVEQRLALGDLPDEIARRLNIDADTVHTIGEEMDALAHQEDNDDDIRFQRADPQLCGRGRHLLAGDNLVKRSNGKKECLPCKRDRERAKYLLKKAS